MEKSSIRLTTTCAPLCNSKQVPNNYRLNNIIAVATGDRRPVGPIYYVYEVL